MAGNGWTRKQQQMVHAATRKAGWDSGERYLVMRHCGCLVDPDRGQPSVKHPRNTQRQFQMLMSFIEPVAAQLGDPIHPPAEHESWTACVNDQGARLRHRIMGLCEEAHRKIPSLYDEQLACVAVRHCADHDTVGFLPSQPERLDQCDLPTLIRVYECLRAWVGREFAVRAIKPRTFEIPRSARDRARNELDRQRRRGN